MKIAYVLPINIEKYDGVLNKVESQVDAWTNQGNKVIIYLITPNKNYPINNTSLGNINAKGLIKVFYVKQLKFIPVDMLKDCLGMNSIYSRVLESIAKFNPDIIYTRNTNYHPFYRKLVNNYKLILEINTDMYSEYKIQAFDSVRYFLRFIYFSWTQKLLVNNLSGIASVTYEIASKYKDHKIPIEVFPNSIDTSKYKSIAKVFDGQRILFIGSPGMPWQGVDILVKLALRMPEIQFDIIGISEIEFTSGFPENVNFHGYLKKSEYIHLFEKATATISSLALFRKNMEEACPLKVREYIAFHRPIILPYRDTAFELEGYPEWVLKLPNNEEEILKSIDKIREFLKKCPDFNITKEAVRKYIDVEIIEKNRLEFFKNIASKRSN